ncbi:MAG TPA: alpha/beta hydrolase fold domain-containing protein [Pyrinomonadaceae bacterium]|nr:alpha/beta hydrolase fold domain-containing protein [Pyrinomonadaceae bacterium]
MKRFLLSISLILVCLNVLCAQTPARKLSPEEEEAKRAIEARLAESVEAMRRKDTPARLEWFTPDWRAKTIDGDVMTLKDLEEHFRRQDRNILSVAPETGTVVDTIELKGDEATVHTSQKFVRTVRGADGKPAEVRSSVTHNEVWVKTDRGWLIKYIEELEQGPTFVNGVEVAQDRAGWKFVRVVWEEGVAKARAAFEEARRRDPKAALFEEATLNNLGYKLIQRGRVKDAIEVFKINTEAYPQSGNVWDSLGEAYMLDGQRELAVQNYKKSLDLNPKNANAVWMLEKMGSPLAAEDIWKLLGSPAAVELVPDVVYSEGSGRALRMHVLRPKARPREPMPVIVFVHGGGWFEGHRSRGLGPLARFAERGYFCASIEYRLSGEAKFPAQIEDVKEAVRFLRAKAAEFHLDPERIGVWGQSAGGHLAALAGTSGDVKELEGAGGWRKFSSRVQAVVDWNGPVDFLEPVQIKRWAERKNEALVKLIGGAPEANRERAARAMPATYATPDDPPFLIMHGDADEVVLLSQSESLHQALKRAGVDSTLNVVKGAGHFGVDGVSPLPAELAAQMDAFFDKHLKKK